MSWFGGGPTIPVLRFTGPIGMATPLRPGLGIATTADAIERAFAYKRAPAVAVVINSPGGSPVQSHLIMRRIRALAAEKEKRVIVFCEDVAASGGYLLALSGDEIYADASSIVGSIGVVSAGFGFDRFLERHAIDRRVYTAGEHKFSLDPFRVEQPDEVERLRALQREIHDWFIALVRERRQGKLAREAADLFTGEIWSGKRAAELGLIDGIGELRAKLRELYGHRIRLKVIASEGGWLKRRLGLWAGAGSPSLADDALSAVEARSLWARFGL
jgi:signal peptide peptidase SppA